MAYVKELDSTSENEPISKWIGWICCVVPFYYRNTYPKDEGAGDDALKIAPAFMLQSQITSWSINFNKNTRVPMMDMDLTAGPIDPLKQAGAGDWIFFWAFTNQNDHDRILESLKNRISGSGKPSDILNDFDSGLKFVGRVHGVRRSKSVSVSGAINTRFFITAVAMQEAETKIVLSAEGRTMMNNDPDIAKNETSWLNAVFGSAKELIKETEQAQIITPDRLISRVIDLFLGPGATPLGAADTTDFDDGQKEDADLQRKTSPNSSIKVPALVANMLGHKTPPGENSAFFSSIIGKSIGRELYTNDNIPAPSIRYPLKGSFLLQSDQVINKSVWNIIEECACQPLNEVYTSMRLNRQMRILPTITVRQVPINERPAGTKTTVLGLPRWVVSSKMVMSEDIGVSDANRYNYVWLHPIDPSKYGEAAIQSAANMLKKSPPVFDTANAKRSGLRTMVAEFRLVDDGSNGGKEPSFSAIAFNAMRNGHLKWNGRITTVGIQEPISIGDNVLYDDVLYNINGITHRGRINSSGGEKTFDTTIELASGISFTETSKRDSGSDFPDSEQPKGLTYEFLEEPGSDKSDAE